MSRRLWHKQMLSTLNDDLVNPAFAECEPNLALPVCFLQLMRLEQQQSKEGTVGTGERGRVLVQCEVIAPSCPNLRCTPIALTKKFLAFTYPFWAESWDWSKLNTLAKPSHAREGTCAWRASHLSPRTVCRHCLPLPSIDTPIHTFVGLVYREKLCILAITPPGARSGERWSFCRLDFAHFAIELTHKTGTAQRWEILLRLLSTGLAPRSGSIRPVGEEFRTFNEMRFSHNECRSLNEVRSKYSRVQKVIV